MLYSLASHKLKVISIFIMLGMGLLTSSCMPESTGPRTVKANTASGNNTPVANTYKEPSFPFDGVFIHEGVNQSVGNLTIPTTFSDSFLIRGKTLSKYLSNIPNTTKFCLSGRFGVDNQDKYLLLTAKPRSFTNLVDKTTEFYLQVEPSNNSANQNDCLSYNLINKLYVGATSPTTVFSISQVCPTCNSANTSRGLKLFFINGEEVPSINFSFLTLTLAGDTSNTGNMCFDSSGCKARGFDCCLEAQCVKDAAVRPGVNLTDPAYLSAAEDVKLNPDRFVIYPQYYFVCNTKPPTLGTGSTGTITDPSYEVTVRLRELNQLYQCLNKVDEEFSYCTLKFPAASGRIPGNFSGLISATDPAQNFYDDINFSTSNPNLLTAARASNFARIIYAGETIFDSKANISLPGVSLLNTSPLAANDTLDRVQGVHINRELPANAQDDTLYLTYKVDGTCSRVGSTLFKCSKTFIQNSNELFSTTWHDSSRSYRLPLYADMNLNIMVKVSGTIVPEESSTWQRAGGNTINFSNYPVYDSQSVEITYFVTNPRIVAMKNAAQSQVNRMCDCGTLTCNLRPVLNSSDAIINYECVYPTAVVDDPPANQTVFVSGKNIPHRFFDSEGVPHDDIASSTLAQENSPGGNAFLYQNNDVLRPNNINQYIGFNEIYGSFYKTGTQISRPARTVRVKKDKTYDILVNNGVFSSCISCGADYYSALQRIFPQSFTSSGGGYTPDNYASSRQNNTGLYRADDLLFGRACFVPATMIPWTHVTGATAREQRWSRLAAQHLMFANGYQRDWYGFDYGSLIGSFDGVKWFSVGNQRRIKSPSNKLFLAVNAYYGDLNIDNSFNVTVSETSPLSSDIPDHDLKSDGAECQKSHFCSTDNDCIRQLGYDYTCQNVSTLTTEWPNFDGAGSEIVGTTNRTLASLLGGTSGQSRRCVYRGRGAPCSTDLNISPSLSFNGTQEVGQLACSSNNYCAALSTGRFNDRIARFGGTPANQNITHEGTLVSDTVGLGARIIGRPFDYYGNKTAPLTARAALNQNRVQALCVPGREVSAANSTNELNSRVPAMNTENSDKLYGVGTSLSFPSLKSLMACTTTDSAGTLISQSGMTFSDAGLRQLNLSAVTQNLSSNLLDLNHQPLRDQKIFSSSSATSPISSIGYQRNACLRAPGAACFTDLECGPSQFVASRVKAVTLFPLINQAEERFWEEEMICGNPDFKHISPTYLNPNFDLKKNKCCRDMGRTLTVETQLEPTTSSSEPKPQWCDVNSRQIRVAGINTPLNSPTRYSRVHSGYDKMTCNPEELGGDKTFALSLATPTTMTTPLRERMRFEQILQQYKTLDTINSRTCCSANWVRAFHPENGGGNSFNRSKAQRIDKTMFKNISWEANNTYDIPDGSSEPFECKITNYQDLSCEIKSLSATEEKTYLEWAGSLELLGIPQVGIKTNDVVYQLVDENQNAFSPAGSKPPLKNTVKDFNLTAADFNDGTTPYYSAASYEKFEMGEEKLKKVFSENTFNCCVPTGQIVPESVGNGQCCTGNVANNNDERRCCLPDFTNVSVYLNRYVSSEGRGLPDSAYDHVTGFIKDPFQARLLAQQKNICCSKKMAFGVAVSNMSIPLTDGDYTVGAGSTTRRFTYRNDVVDDNGPTGGVGGAFDAGVRWNNHVYCVPVDF